MKCIRLGKTHLVHYYFLFFPSSELLYLCEYLNTSFSITESCHVFLLYHSSPSGRTGLLILQERHALPASGPVHLPSPQPRACTWRLSGWLDPPLPVSVRSPQRDLRPRAEQPPHPLGRLPGPLGPTAVCSLSSARGSTSPRARD